MQTIAGMIIYKDILTGDELISDSYDMKTVDNIVYEVDCAPIPQEGNELDSGGDRTEAAASVSDASSDSTEAVPSNSDANGDASDTGPGDSGAGTEAPVAVSSDSGAGGDSTDSVSSDVGVGGDGTKLVNNVVHSFRLQPVAIDKKAYLTYMRGYIRHVKEALREHGRTEEEVKAFETTVNGYLKQLLAKFSECKFYTGESKNPDGMLAPLRVRADGTPYLTFIKPGLIDMKV